MQTHESILDSFGEFLVPRSVTFIPTIEIIITLKEKKTGNIKKITLNAGEVIYMSTKEELYRGNEFNLSSPEHNAEKAIEYNNNIIFLYNKINCPVQLVLYRDNKHYTVESDYKCQSYDEYMRSIIKKIILPIEGIKDEVLCKYLICVPNSPSGEFVLNN
jgi:transcriptional regulator